MSNADIVFALFCVLVLPFAYGRYIPLGRNCSCIGGLTCDFTYVYCAPFDIGECKRENVALGQMATISSYVDVDKDFGNAACVGVNGNIENFYIELKELPTQGNCIHTNPWQKGIHFWEVDLGKEYLIKYITVYPRTLRIERMQLVSVMVGRTNCYTFQYPVPLKPHFNIECKPPVTSRIVRLEKPLFETRYGIKQVDYAINVCEVQVWVCRQGFYGEECKERCDPCVNCDILTGACSGGCKVGHFGYRCLQTCWECLDNKCNDQGICQAGCKTGFEGDKCEFLTLTAAQAESTETEVVGVGMYVGIGFLILALLASGVVFYILVARRKKKEEGGERNVQTSQETETPAAPENDEPDAQETVVELTPYPPPGKESSV